MAVLKKYWWVIAIAAIAVYYFGYHRKGKGFFAKDPNPSDVTYPMPNDGGLMPTPQETTGAPPQR